MWKNPVNLHIHSIFDRIEMSQELIFLVEMQGPIQSIGTKYRQLYLHTSQVTAPGRLLGVHKWKKKYFKELLRARNGTVSSWILFNLRNSRQWGGKQWIVLKNIKFKGRKLTAKNSSGFFELFLKLLWDSTFPVRNTFLAMKRSCGSRVQTQWMGSLSSWSVRSGLTLEPSKASFKCGTNWSTKLTVWKLLALSGNL